MANIKITVEGPLMDGHKITFKAPCNCDVVEKLDVRYIESNTQKSKLFTMKDSHGNDLTGLGNLFYQDAYVDVVLDTNSLSAYLQNAGTNGYLEERLKTAGTPVDNLESDRADLPLSARQGKILNNSLGGVRFGIDEKGNCGFFDVNGEFIAFKRNTKTQTINTTMSGQVSPWVFTFNELTEIEQVTLSYSYQDINHSLNSNTDDRITINENSVEFTHATDSATWTITCVAIGY